MNFTVVLYDCLCFGSQVTNIIENMRINYSTEYAFRILIYLQTRPDQCVSTREIAEAFGLSVNHLNKVSHTMVNLELLSASRGRGGGIQLKEKALEYPIGQLMKALEPQEEVAQCQGTTSISPCMISTACRLRSLLAEAQQAFWNHLDEYKVKDLTPNLDALTKLIHRS